MFAGPNGSGKSTLQQVVPPYLLGFYINADDLERYLRSGNGFDLSGLPVQISVEELNASLAEFSNDGSASAAGLFVVRGGRLRVEGAEGMGYHAAATAQVLRQKLLESGYTVSFETVMSHRSKIDLLGEARAMGYRTYLYYIATEDPDINVSRVKSRVQFGGHDVPEDKIRERYRRSLELLPAAIQNSDRAYIFDNSVQNEERVWVAEFDGDELELKIDADRVPKWFAASVLSHLRVG